MFHLELVADMVVVALLSFWFDVVFGLLDVYFSECLGEICTCYAMAAFVF